MNGLRIHGFGHAPFRLAVDPPQKPGAPGLDEVDTIAPQVAGTSGDDDGIGASESSASARVIGGGSRGATVIVARAEGAPIVGTVTNLPDGGQSSGYVATFGSIIAAGGVTVDPIGGASASAVVRDPSSGQTVAGASNAWMDGSSAHGYCGSEGSGLRSFVQANAPDGSSQQSSFFADGSGNSSETTVTNDADGSFTIAITNTSPDGMTTREETSYDADGRIRSSEVMPDDRSSGNPGARDGDDRR